MTNTTLGLLASAAGFVGLGVLIWRENRLKAINAEGLSQLAGEKGWNYEDSRGKDLAKRNRLPVHGESLDLVYESTILGTFKSTVVWQRVRGEVAGMPFECLQVSGHQGGKEGTENFSVVSLKCAMKPAQFSIVPQDFATHMRALVGRPAVVTGHSGFDHHFRVEATDDANVRSILNNEVVDYLTEKLHGRLYGLTDRLTLVLERELTADLVVEGTEFLEQLWAVVPAEVKG